MGLRYFDVVVLVTAGRFTEAEALLVRELARLDVPYFAVRNKIDDVVQCAIDEEDDPEMCESRKEEIKCTEFAKVRRDLMERCDLEHVYLISTKAALRKEYDFTALCQDLVASVRARRADVESESQCP